MNAMRAFFAKFQKDERGVTAIEYGLIAIAMAAALTAVFGGTNSISSKLKEGFSSISTQMDSMTKHSNAVEDGDEGKGKGKVNIGGL
ncbi:Flp family type IVb pilin [Photobacterium leiognathi]|uniref:Flp family type IVb pilin n=1 Tax=Photobacterium leiognathi TaxID=553611 RepID=UPI00298190F3|nr:Flp family type IVb pilin [Photobacterium leiognathi]